jgi:hypothetical protein
MGKKKGGVSPSPKPELVKVRKVNLPPPLQER